MLCFHEVMYLCMVSFFWVLNILENRITYHLCYHLLTNTHGVLSRYVCACHTTGGQNNLFWLLVPAWWHATFTVKLLTGLSGSCLCAGSNCVVAAATLVSPTACWLQLYSWTWHMPDNPVSNCIVSRPCLQNMQPHFDVGEMQKPCILHITMHVPTVYHALGAH